MKHLLKHLLLTGSPGCGKTTVVRKVVARLRESSLPLRGFWTEETRAVGRRTGFRIETVTGNRGLLASADLPGPPRLGRYGVDLASFESVAVAEVEAALRDAAAGVSVTLVIDEIGKMELFSDRFRSAAEHAFSHTPHVVATVMRTPHPFADALKARPDVTLVTVTPENRDHLPAEIICWLA